MEPDAAYRPPDHDEPPPAPSVEPSRPPTLIIAVCSVWIFEIAIGLVRIVRLYFGGVFDLSIPSRQLVLDAILLGAVKGLWSMRKWGVVVFVIASAILLFSEGAQLIRIEWLLLPVATLIVSIRYFRQMRW